MPKFIVARLIDAWVIDEAEVEAASANEAAQLANDWPQDYEWENWGTKKFDARFYITLDENGKEIESTRVGRVC